MSVVVFKGSGGHGSDLNAGPLDLPSTGFDGIGHIDANADKASPHQQ